MDFVVARSVVDNARQTLARLMAAGDYPAPTPNDRELGLDFGGFSETSTCGVGDE